MSSGELTEELRRDRQAFIPRSAHTHRRQAARGTGRAAVSTVRVGEDDAKCRTVQFAGDVGAGRFAPLRVRAPVPDKKVGRESLVRIGTLLEGMQI